MSDLHINYKNLTIWHVALAAFIRTHYSHTIISVMAFQIRSKKTSKLRVTGILRGICRWPVNSPHKVPVTRKMFAFDDVIHHVLSVCRLFKSRHCNSVEHRVIFELLNVRARKYFTLYKIPPFSVWVRYFEPEKIKLCNFYVNEASTWVISYLNISKFKLW